jgi:RNA polymerase sigma-70 factor (TIGR02960 family)
LASATHLSIDEQADLEAARQGDEAAFARLVERHRRSLHAHCYRMLGSAHDADDALQDTLLAAWKGLHGFAGTGSFRSWLYRIATNASIRVGQRRRRRMLAPEVGPAFTQVWDLGPTVTEPVFIEPYPDAGLADRSGTADPEARYDLLESVELGFVAALQALPATQRAVLVLRDVLAIPAAEVAETLATTVASVNSALQRARKTMAGRVDPVTQQATRRALGDEGEQQLVQSFIRAWEHHDVDGLVGLLAEDARLTMPPMAAWFTGRAAIGEFFADRAFDRPWRFVPITASGQLAVVGYMGDDAGAYPLQNVNVLTLRGRDIAAVDCFHAPTIHPLFALPPDVPA